MKQISASVYKTNSTFLWVFTALMTVSSVICLVGLVSLIFKVEFISGLSIWNYIIFLIQGGIFGLIVAWKSFNSRKYTIELKEDEINFNMPKAKKPVQIKLNEIQTLTVLDNKIELFLKDNITETINLNYFYLPLKEDIKNYFVEFKSKIDA